MLKRTLPPDEVTPERTEETVEVLVDSNEAVPEGNQTRHMKKVIDTQSRKIELIIGHFKDKLSQFDQQKQLLQNQMLSTKSIDAEKLGTLGGIDEHSMKEIDLFIETIN